MWTTIFKVFLTPIINAHILYGGTCHFVSDHLVNDTVSNSLHCISFLAASLLPTQLLLLLLVVVILDLLNADVLEGTELKEVGGRETILMQHCHHKNDSALTAV